MIKVLIVDDQELFRESLKVVLSVSDNIRVTDAVSGVAQALKSAEQDRPDVVLMDVEMPGMNGIECGKAIQDRAPKTIIIFATAHEEYMKSAFELYAFDYLVKPFSLERALKIEM